MEREVGGGIGMGNTCKPMAVSFQCMKKSNTIKKKNKKKRSECLSPDDLSRALSHWPWSVGELRPRILPGLQAEPLGYNTRAQEEQGALSPVHAGVALGSLCLNLSPPL